MQRRRNARSIAIALAIIGSFCALATTSSRPAPRVLGVQIEPEDSPQRSCTAIIDASTLEPGQQPRNEGPVRGPLVIDWTGCEPAATSEARVPRWEAPHTAGYRRLTITEPGDVWLDNDVDYLIDLPNALPSRLRLRGGRNIVIFGGEFFIDDDDPAFDPALGSNDAKSLVIYDDTSQPVAPADGRIVHLEGILVRGPWAQEGLAINAPSAIVQVQNWRVERLRGLRTGAHADVIQPWGSYRELRVDLLTGYSDYQGLFLKADANGPLGLTHLSRVNIVGTENDAVESAQDGGRTLFWWDYYERFGISQIRTDGTVWIAPHPSKGPAESAVEPRPAKQADGSLVLVDEISPFLTWNQRSATDQIPVADWSGDQLGQIRIGVPPDGDWVPPGVAGVGYEPSSVTRP